MNNTIGWIKLHRKITDNPIWEDKPFARGQAFIDLLLMADNKDGEGFFKGKVISTKCGEVRTSKLYLAERWGWGNRKITTFLTELEKAKMCTVKCTPKCTTIFIENYAKYSANFTEGAQQNAHQNAYQMHNKCITNAHTQEYKEIKNKKRENKKREKADGGGLPKEALDVPSWLDLGDDFFELTAQDQRARLFVRKREKKDELKKHAQSYGLYPDVCEELAKECLEKHGADPKWIDEEITGVKR